MVAHETADGKFTDSHGLSAVKVVVGQRKRVCGLSLCVCHTAMFYRLGIKILARQTKQNVSFHDCRESSG